MTDAVGAPRRVRNAHWRAAGLSKQRTSLDADGVEHGIEVGEERIERIIGDVAV
jgi:hypothetical protein